MATATSSPANQLVGRTLEGGWTVIEKLDRPPSATGGQFSVGYVVESEEGHRAYLKALDFAPALSSADPARALEAMTAAFNFERDLLERCRALDRVAVSIGDGSVAIQPGNPFANVQYLLFELADGDIRSKLDPGGAFDLAWSLRSVHQIAVGLQQLHGIGIAHQDLKPSNVLVYGDHGLRLADLGRASARGETPPHDKYRVAGDLSYGPPELLYGSVATEFNERRLACDLYLLGSMIAFFFTTTSMTSLLMAELDPSHRWRQWGGRYQDALPMVREAFARAVELVAQDLPPGDLSDRLILALRQLCDPDPSLRGHPKNRAARTNSYSIERYVSILNLLATRVELGLPGVSSNVP